MSSPRHHEADVALRDGSTVHVRPVRAEDAPAVRAFFERLSPRSIALRFFSGFPDLDRAVRWATEIDDQHRYGLVATGADGRVVAHAGWEREPDRPGRAEVAFAIADAMQHNGLGTILLGQLIEAADQAGVAVLSAEVLPQNQHMLHLFGDSGIPVTTHTLPGVVLDDRPAPRPAEPALGSRSGRLRAGQLHQDPRLPHRPPPLSAAAHRWVPASAAPARSFALRPSSGRSSVPRERGVDRAGQSHPRVRLQSRNVLAKTPPTGWRGR
jgi:L-amino acid N-acyltransferase YncA